MKFSEFSVPKDPLYVHTFREDALVYIPNGDRCINCGAACHWVSIFLEGALCSSECSDAVWKEVNSHPDPEAFEKSLTGGDIMKPRYEEEEEEDDE